MRDRFLALIRGNHAIQPLMHISTKRHVITENIEHTHHLAENEHAMAILTQASEEFVQKHHFATVHDESFEDFVIVVAPCFSTIKEIRVIGGLLKLHGDVQETNVVVAVRALDKSREILQRNS